MAALTHLDTHVLVWLFIPRVDLLSPAARDAIEASELAVSPMVILELTYLQEIGRLNVDGSTVVTSLTEQIGLQVDETPFNRVVTTAHGQRWTRDPFDRLIASHALAASADLVTADETIRENLPTAVW